MTTALSAARTIALLAAFAAPAVRASAEDYWTYEETDEDFIPRIRLAPHIGVWIGEFDRTTRGCSDVQTSFPTPEIDGAVAIPPPEDDPVDPNPDPFCPTNNSDEIGLSAGVSAVYRVLGPLHLSVGLDLALTFPSREFLEGQFIVAIPIGVGLTHDAWAVRPIANATLTPYVSLPDLRRGFAWGGEWGLAFRIPDLAEIQIVGGYHASSDWQMGIVRFAGYLP